MRLSVLLSTTALVALSALPSIAYADNDSAGEITISATRIPTPVTEVADSVTVITADEIAARQEQTLPDVLKDVPGLNIVQTGGPGGQTSVFMRGTNSNHVKVLIDGIDVSDPSNPNASFDFGQFLTADIERVEVLRGPQSGLYGSDAIGGVINIITKSGNGPAQFKVAVEGGSFGTFNQTGSVSGSESRFHYAATVTHLRQESTPVTPEDLLPPGEKRNNDSYDNDTVSTKLGYDVADNFDVGFVGRYTRTQLGLTGDNYAFYPAIPDAEQSYSDTTQYYARGTAHLSLMDGRFQQTLGVAYSSISSADSSPDDGNSYYSGDRVKVDWQGNFAITPTEMLVLGAEHARDEARLPISASNTIDAGYAELQSNPFENFYDTITVRYDGNSHFGGKTTYRIAPTYLIAATGTQLKASVGTGFKAPTLSEMYESYPAYGFYANPNLKPESATGYDAGFEQTVIKNKLSFGATYYRINIDNLITDNAFYTTYINVGKAHTEGAESFIEFKPLDVLTLRLDYTYTFAMDDITNQELLRRPRHKGNLDAHWQATDKLSLDLNVIAVGSWVDGNRDFSIPRLKPAGYGTADVAGSYDLTDIFSVYARVTNLLDKQYEDPTGFLRPGRGAFGGVRAKF